MNGQEVLKALFMAGLDVDALEVITSVDAFVNDSGFTRRAIEALQRQIDVRDNDCPYTHAHTRDWCGRPGCRES